jgi:hypothetical protein
VPLCPPQISHDLTRARTRAPSYWQARKIISKQNLSHPIIRCYLAWVIGGVIKEDKRNKG